ncbi:MAG: HEAT repeat domain-containing protein [Promethearchaeota archaeon]
MKKSLTPEKIQKDYSTGNLGKENAADLLISLIDSSDNTEIRVRSIKVLEKLQFQNEKTFKMFENLLISDENASVRASVIEYLIQNFLEESLPALRWVIQHEKSPLVIKLLYDFIERSFSPQLKIIKKDLTLWVEDFSSKIGIIPQESIFFLDLEALFAKGKRSYEIDPSIYKYFEKLTDIKHGEPWLVIKKKHVEILNFNYFNWKFIKNNTDILTSLSKLQDLDVYLCSLRKYSHNQILLSTIPESIGSLIFLKKLFLRRNGLKKLPVSMKNLSMLKELDISYNKFEEIPKVINSFNKLEILNIKHNFIQNVPDSLSYYIKVIR